MGVGKLRLLLAEGWLVLYFPLEKANEKRLNCDIRGSHQVNSSVGGAT